MNKNQPIISNEKRKMLGNKLAELANITAGAMVFGQFLSNGFNLTIFIWGIVIAMIFYMLSLKVHPN